MHEALPPGLARLPRFVEVGYLQAVVRALTMASTEISALLAAPFISSEVLPDIVFLQVFQTIEHVRT
jgi:hypothetical protein